MTGINHYTEAQRLLSDASFTGVGGRPVRRDGMSFAPEQYAGLLAKAQVHATLALAATQADGVPAPVESVIFRAEHDSIVMGLYTTRAAARAHCETHLRREIGDTGTLGWIPGYGAEDAPEELSVFGPDRGEETITGYVVTPLTVASAYDEEADE